MSERPWLLLSHEVNANTPAFGGGKELLQLHKKAEICQGRSCNESELHMPIHFGTHIDLPYHFDDSGQRLHETTPADWFFVKPYRVTVPAQTGELLDLKDERESIPRDCDFLAIQTGWEKHRGQDLYWNQNPGLKAELGEWLRTNRPSVRCVALDTISLTSYVHRDEGRIAHRAFLANVTAGAAASPAVNHPIWVIEDAKLSAWPAAEPTQILVSPLWLRDAEGSPVTIWAR